MLASLVLQLKSPAGARLPATLGRAVQAALLNLINERDPTLAKALHNNSGLKPFTVSNLVLGHRQAGSLHITAGQEGWLRFTGLTARVSEYLLALAAAPPEAVEIDGHILAVTGAVVDPAAHPWAGRISYQDLAAPYLLGGLRQSTPPADSSFSPSTALRTGPQPLPFHKIRLEFASPTTFKSKDRYLPLPLPDLVFGSLLDRWQAFAPIALHPETRRFAGEAVALSRYKLRTRGAPYKQGGGGAGERGSKMGWRIGFTGQVTFTVLNRDRYWLNVLRLLAAFAFYSGVGLQTGAGMGQTRPV